MKLKDARKSGIKYCEENNYNYTYISYNDIDEFYLANEEDKHIVFLVSRNGSLNAYHASKYASDFHRELRKRRKKRNNNKKKIADMCNYDSLNFDEDEHSG